MNDQKNNETLHETLQATSFEPSEAGASRGHGGHRLVTLAAFVLLAGLGGLAVYLFTGQSVLITFDPHTEEVEVEGGWWELQLADRWLLHPGTFEVTAELEGYHPFSGSIEVSDQPQQEFLFSLERLPTLLNVSTNPPVEAELRIDGQGLGTAPLQGHELPEGSYTLEVLADRYQPWEQVIDIEGGGNQRELVVDLVPGWAEVTLRSSPEGATLWVDGQARGQTPLTAELLMGTREVELRLPGYKSWSENLRVPDNQPQVLDPVTLELADNLVRLESRPSRASVTINGEYRGETPLELELPPGREYQFRFSKAGYLSARRSLQVERGQEAQLSVDLPPVLGEVRITGVPAGAVVLVDGVARGNAGQSFSLPARPTRIQVQADGHQTYETTVTPNPDLATEVRADMPSMAEVRAARTPDLLNTSIGYQLALLRPAGRIELGSPRREQGRRANEFQRQVQMGRAFYLGVTEVSNAQFQRFLSGHDSGVVDEYTLALPEQPAVRVSWDQAARFCNWLSQQEGLPAAYVESQGMMVPVEPMTTGYRLPTETEWVLASRYRGNAGGASLKYPWGDSLPPPDSAGNFAGSEAAGIAAQAISNYRDEFPVTAPVGHYPGDENGIKDLGGNVREWMHDFYAVNPAAQSAAQDPMGPPDGLGHVVRGASWRSGTLSDLRLAWRESGQQAADDIGFRVARYAD